MRTVALERLADGAEFLFSGGSTELKGRLDYRDEDGFSVLISYPGKVRPQRELWSGSMQVSPLESLS